MTDANQPLAGVRVVDFTHVLAGPFCTQLLADAGAEVIKIERPGGGYERVRGPRRSDGAGAEVSSYCAAVNRGKESVVLDLKNPAGRRIALDLARKADIVVENFTPHAIERLGINLSQLRNENPRIITVSISLYGATTGDSSLSARPGLALVAEAESGITNMTRDSTGAPIQLGLMLGDMASGLAAYAGVTSALYLRETSGIGQHLDISMVRTLLALNAPAFTATQIATQNLYDVQTAASGIFAATDGYVALGINNDSLFRRLARAIGQEQLADDPRYASYYERDSRAPEVNDIVGEWASGRSAAEVVAALNKYGVPAGRVATTEQILADPEIRQLGLFAHVDDGVGGDIRAPQNPMGFSGGSCSIPHIAEHSRQVLRQILDIGSDEYDVLNESGAFGA